MDRLPLTMCAARLQLFIILLPLLPLSGGTTEFDQYLEFLDFFPGHPRVQERHIKFIPNILAQPGTVIGLSTEGDVGNPEFCTPGGDYNGIAVNSSETVPVDCKPMDEVKCHGVSQLTPESVIIPERIGQIETSPAPGCSSIIQPVGEGRRGSGMELVLEGPEDCPPYRFLLTNGTTLVMHWKPSIEIIDAPTAGVFCISQGASECIVEVYLERSQESHRIRVRSPGDTFNRTVEEEGSGVVLHPSEQFFVLSMWFEEVVLDGTSIGTAVLLANGNLLGRVEIVRPIDKDGLCLVFGGLSQNPKSSLYPSFRGRLYDWHEYGTQLPQRWQYEMYNNGGVPVDIPASECYCSGEFSLLSELDYSLCARLVKLAENSRTRRRTNEHYHSLNFLRNPLGESFWLSRLDVQSVTISITFDQAYSVFGASINFISSPPRQMRIFLKRGQGQKTPVLSVSTNCLEDYQMNHTTYEATADIWAKQDWNDRWGTDLEYKWEHVCTHWEDHGLDSSNRSFVITAVWLTAKTILSYVEVDIIDSTQFVADEMIIEMEGSEVGYYAIGQVKATGKCPCDLTLLDGCSFATLPSADQISALNRFNLQARDNETYRCSSTIQTTQSGTPTPTNSVTESATSNPQERGGESNSLDTATTIGIGVGTAGVAFLVVVVLCYVVVLRKRMMSGGHSQEDRKRRVSKKMSSNTRYVADPTPTVIQMKELDEETFIKVQKCLIPRDNLKLGVFLGKGNFGTVHSGQLSFNRNWIKVAVKTLKETTEDGNSQAFLVEATIMMDFSHENVLELLGVTYDEGRPLVILPFMKHGDLRALLKDENKQTFENGDYLHFCMQISHGMSYLSKEKFVHRDLATRNCMVSDTYVVKIADFGLTQDIYERDYYRAQDHSKPLPVKWMAPESLCEGRFSSQTDVWSFGVVLWEVFTNGAAPYPGISNFEMKTYISEGKRMDQPCKCPDEIYDIMKSCWNMDGNSRPTFHHLSVQLTVLCQEQPEEKLYRKTIAVDHCRPSVAVSKPTLTEKDYLQLL